MAILWGRRHIQRVDITGSTHNTPKSHKMISSLIPSLSSRRRGTNFFRARSFSLSDRWPNRPGARKTRWVMAETPMFHLLCHSEAVGRGESVPASGADLISITSARSLSGQQPLYGCNEPGSWESLEQCSVGAGGFGLPLLLIAIGQNDAWDSRGLGLDLA